MDVETGFGLLSVPADGCLADARAELAGSVEAAAGWTTALNEIEFLRADANNRTLADADVVAATSEWAGCMKVSGFDVAAPHAAVELAWSKDYNEAGEASDWEILVATTDTRCRVEADLDRITEDRRSYYENAVLGDNEGVVLAWGETRDAMRAILSDVLDLGG